MVGDPRTLASSRCRDSHGFMVGDPRTLASSRCRDSLNLVTKAARMRRSVKAGLTTAFALLAAVLVFVPAGTAAAANTNFGKIGDVYSPSGLSLPVSLLFYIGIPIVGFAVAGMLAFRPSKGANRRYRPGRAWVHEPVWFGDESALEREPTRAALPGAGGASGSW
jgi:hypothetical protein